MKFTPSEILPEVIIIEPDVFKDNRGYFLETYHAKKYSEHGISAKFFQDNRSQSKEGVIRGLHYQLTRPQGKLIWVIDGEIMDVAVDIRKGSPTFGKWTSAILSSDNFLQLYIPEGFAHGFCVVSITATFIYKCTDYYDPESERGIIWNDPFLDIEWPVSRPILSEKDKKNPSLKEIPVEDLPVYIG